MSERKEATTESKWIRLCIVSICSTRSVRFFSRSRPTKLESLHRTLSGCKRRSSYLPDLIRYVPTERLAPTIKGPMMPSGLSIVVH